MKLLFQKIADLKIFEKDKIVLEFASKKLCFLVYVGIENGDETKDLVTIIREVENLPIVDRDGKFALTLRETKPTIIFVSQITLIADFEKDRINFNRGLEQDVAKAVFDNLARKWQELGYDVLKTPFGSHLFITSTNIGPVNFIISK
ncbi:MAG: D-aminoacyl-tRNA deacylase [Patescibacteria group bacterium]|nr:D-aminoacyl-tRNA deacylase [Patescibacteria group bacterium]